MVQTAIFGLGILLILVVAKGFFHFTGMSDKYFSDSYGPAFVDALKEDRMSLYSADLLRSGFFIVVTFAILWLFVKNKFSQNTALIIVGILMIFDLFFVDKRYVSAKDFVSPVQIAAPFQESPVDAKILEDKSIYRVFDVQGQLQGRSSYFHKTIGGYSAVRPRRMQQLMDYQIQKGNIEALNMLNVKYVIQTNKEGNEIPVANPEANGNAWFVGSVKVVNTPDDVMKSLDNIDTKNVAVFNVHDYEGKFKSARLKKEWDTAGTIKVVEYKPNYIKYQSENKKDGLAVFSEIYYKNGWNAYVDGQLTDHFPVDYVLRAMELPGGKHTIEFKFEPKVIQTGGTIALASSIGMFLLLVGGIYFEKFFRKDSQRMQGDTQK